MKRRQFIRQIESEGCEFARAGGRHDIYVNLAGNQFAAVPRHTEIPDTLCKVIRKELGLPRKG